ITFSRADKEEISELKESEEKFRESSRELWKEFAVHGILRFDHKEKKIKSQSHTDLDGKTCLGFLKMAGFNVDNVTYVPPGEFIPGATNLDTGMKTGIVVSEEDETAWFDHHGNESTEKSIPASRHLYLGLISKGFLKKDPVLDKLSQFVSRVDRAQYPDAKELFTISDRTVFGLQRFFSFENLYDYFQQGRSPQEILSDEDLEKYGLVQRSNEQRGVIKSSLETIEKLKENGFVIKTKFGEVVIDIDKKVAGGYQAVRAADYDGYVLYSPRFESFFISIHQADLSKIDFSQGKNIRENMWIKPQDEKKPLTIPLREVIEKLGGEIPKQGSLKETTEMIDLRFKEFIVTPLTSRDKNNEIKTITWDLGKLAIFPKDFKFDPGKKYKVKIKFDSAPGERKGFYILEVLKEAE
ncbi:MAG: hypothetical protein PHE59_05445, partial [Patescibacteria group bacterium]|nr:hypothetical protein [Patescibacteria group bacterium]